MIYKEFQLFYSPNHFKFKQISKSQFDMIRNLLTKSVYEFSIFLILFFQVKKRLIVLINLKMRINAMNDNNMV